MTTKKKKVSKKKKASQFKAGSDKKRNLGGRPTMSREERKLKELTRTRIACMMREFLNISFDELEKAQTDEKIRKKYTMIELCLLKVMYVAYVKGDEKKLEWILSTSFGKLPEKIELSGGLDNKQKINLNSLDDNTIEKLIKAMPDENQKNL